MRAQLVVALTVLCAFVAPATARADDEPWLLLLEGSVAAPVTAPQSDLFGWGGSASVSVFRSLISPLAVGARLRGGLLSDGPAPSDERLRDPGLGGFLTLQLGVRLRFAPLRHQEVQRGTGPWVEVLGGGALTGETLRPALEAGLGWSFELGDIDIGPVVRWSTIFETDSQLEHRPANVLTFGVEVTFFDVRPAPPAAPPAPPSDERCPNEPEDMDGFEDDDGCPDPDNDSDGVLDIDDACPMVPEDRDGFDDEDGCPDPDNDQDGVLDGLDACPDEPEVVNGIDDEDGCPDEGLIELVDDRIVLDARVLFDFERHRLRPDASPVLDAIVELFRQHPEWEVLAIEGHTDEQGEYWFNQRLSEQRAHRVRNALIGLGLQGRTITASGFGETRPRAQGDGETTHQANRRVEFVVVRAPEEATPETVAVESDQ